MRLNDTNENKQTLMHLNDTNENKQTLMRLNSQKYQCLGQNSEPFLYLCSDKLILYYLLKLKG